MESIKIRLGEAGRLVVQAAYSPERVAKIKTVFGRRWHTQEKHWTVPHNEKTLACLLALFAGEPVEADPSLGTLGAPETRSPASGSGLDLSHLLERVRDAIRTRHLSQRTEETYIG